MEIQAQLKRLVTGEILVNEPMSRHTSFGIGGPADFFLRPRTVEEFVAVLRLTRTSGVPLLVVGRGTNILVGDGGVRGVVVDLSLACRHLEERAGGVVVGAGVSVAELLDFCARRGLGGLEFMAGIPGSVGGAIRVNAGAWDRSVGEVVQKITGYDLGGEAVALKSDRVHFQYRNSDLPPDMIITAAELTLTSAPREKIQKRMEKYGQRRRGQPTDKQSAGSVFKNPPGDAAGRLIEETGCKGMEIGGAAVSSQHANFIVNDGGATAAAVRQLIERVREMVKDQFGIELELEILMVGEE